MFQWGSVWVQKEGFQNVSVELKIDLYLIISEIKDRILGS